MLLRTRRGFRSNPSSGRNLPRPSPKIRLPTIPSLERMSNVMAASPTAPQPTRPNSEEPELGNEDDLPQDDEGQGQPPSPAQHPREQAQ
jgi:hypothetical protein